MTKTIYLLRHAQAMPSEGGSDKMRTLSPKGQSDASALGLSMKQKSYTPDIVYCSSATRTKETLDGVLASLPDLQTQYEDNVYTAHPGDLLAMLHRIDDDHDSAMIVGHNPTIHELVAKFSVEGDDSLISRIMNQYRPGTLAVFECECAEWKDLNFEKNTLIDVLDPLDYNAPATPARWT